MSDDKKSDSVRIGSENSARKVRESRQSTAKRWFLAVSAVLHVGFGCAMIINAMWRVDRLPLDRAGKAELNVLMPPGDSGGGAPPKAAPALKPKERQKRIAKTVHQPQEAKPIERVVATGETDGESGKGGGGDGRGFGEPTGGDGCLMPPCGDGPKPPIPLPLVEEPPPKPPAPPQIVPPKAVAALRLSGETDVAPSRLTQTQIERDGRGRVVGTFKLCIGTSGQVTSVTTLASTKYPEYDRDLTAAIWQWRYRPYLVNEQAVPVCSTVTFFYENQ